jgi:hypothetical protein
MIYDWNHLWNPVHKMTILQIMQKNLKNVF